MKKMILGTVVVLATALLAGCAPSTRQPVETTAAPTAPSSPTLRVPETATGSSVQLEVNGGNLPEGTAATIYRFDGGWDGETPACDDPNAETRDITLTGGTTYQVVPFPVIAGVAHWVLVAGDYTTPCGDTNAQTTVLVETSYNVFTGGKDERTKVGQPKKLAVELTSSDTPAPITGTLTVLGPWATLPEARAASCETAPVAFEAPLKFDYSQVNTRAEVEFTPSEPGIYRVIVETPETEQSTATNTCDEGAEAKTFIVEQ